MSLNVHHGMTIDRMKELRGYILRGLLAVTPKGQTERGLMRYLHTMQAMPLPDHFLEAISYLRERGLLRSEKHTDYSVGEDFFLHFITARGIEVASGETPDEHIG